MRMNIFDLVFLLSAVAFNWLIVGIFVTTKQTRPKLRQTFGVAFVLLGIPFTLVFVRYMLQGRSWQTMLLFAVVLFYIAIELFLDYILKFDFRRKLITHIPYIVLEYIAMFSLIGFRFRLIDYGAGLSRFLFRPLRTADGRVHSRFSAEQSG